MTIEQIELTNLAPDEVGYSIDGQYASVRLTRASGAAASMFGFTACAFALELDSSPKLSALLGTFEGWHTVSCPKADLLIGSALDTDKVASLKLAAITGALNDMMALIGEESAFNELNI
jgi:hypothetical protein